MYYHRQSHLGRRCGPSEAAGRRHSTRGPVRPPTPPAGTRSRLCPGLASARQQISLRTCIYRRTEGSVRVDWVLEDPPSSAFTVYKRRSTRSVYVYTYIYIYVIACTVLTLTNKAVSAHGSASPERSPSSHKNWRKSPTPVTDARSKRRRSASLSLTAASVLLLPSARAPAPMMACRQVQVSCTALPRRLEGKLSPPHTSASSLPL